MKTPILILLASILLVSAFTIFITVVPYRRWYRKIKAKIRKPVLFLEHRIVKATKYYYPNNI